MEPFAQAWVLTIEYVAPGEVFGLLTICGDTTSQEPESYGSSGSSKTVFEELGSVLDATMWSFLAIADGTALVSE